jgi:predicted Zn finger-like uncharacterized protein
MKIVCDSCSTKYSISDDKVRGKVFKIRCKKCSHIIVVRGTTEAAALAPEAPPDAVWHLVVDGDQVGPLTDADMRGRLSRSEISSENYVWKEGFADWLRLADVPEFADVVGPAASGGELFSDTNAAVAPEAAPQPSIDIGGFFGAGAAGQEAARSSGSSGRIRAPAVAAAAPVEEDVFSAPPPSSSPSGIDGADLFGAVAPIAARAESGRVRGRSSNGTAPAARHDGGRVENLTAQRSENSVLFSLSNLQSLAAPAASKASTSASPSTITNTDGSGLIDIRAMAASTMKAPAGSGGGLFGGDASRSEDELPSFAAFSSAAPVLLGIPSSSGPPKWFYALMALGALVIIAFGVAAFSILGRPVLVEAPPAAPVVVAPPPPPPAKVAVASGEGKAPGATAPTAVPEGQLPPRENAGPAGVGAGGVDKGAVKPLVAKKFRLKKVGVGGAIDGKAAGGTAAAGAAAPAAEPEKPKPVKGSLDDLLEGALNGRKARPKVDEDSPGKRGGDKGAEPAAGAGPLSKAAVVAGMNSVKGKISACYALYKQPGLAMVNVVIGKSGKISSATVTGKFAGTPTGSCVENAVKSASFPPSDGLTTPYPFTLR